MQNLFNKIESLDLKIRQLIERSNLLRRENNQLIEENTKLKKEKSQYINSLDQLRSEIHALKQNNQHTIHNEGSDIEEMKKELSGYIKEIDECLNLIEH